MCVISPYCRQSNILQEQAAANLAVEEGKKASRDERMFMQTALSQHKAARAKQAEERKKQKQLEKRMKAILKLKDNITSSVVSTGEQAARWGSLG